MKRRLVLAAKLVVTLAFLAWLAARADLADLGRAFAGADSAGLALALALAGLAYPAMAARLHGLLRLQSVDTPFAAVHRLVWVGQFFNAFLPGGAGGDLARAYYLARDHPGRRAAALCALVADRLLGLTLLAVLAALAAAALPVTGPNRPTGLNLVYLFPAGMAAVWVLVLTAPRWPTPTPPDGSRRAAVFAAVRTLGRRPRGLLAGAAWSATVWILDLAAAAALAAAMGLPLGVTGVALTLALGYTAALLPISFGGHGVREGAVVAVAGLALTARGETAEWSVLVAFALGLLGMQLLWSAVGAVVYLAGRSTEPAVGRV